MEPPFDLNKAHTNKYWDQIKEFGIAGLSAATGDPEAMKTIIEVLANATHSGLEKVNLKGETKANIKKKLESSVDTGADGLINAITLYQKKAEETNQSLRKKYGRKYKS